ncbi:type III secretion system co-regulatory protein PtrC [Pseudomonas sp. 5P_3.1_Bac2]|uniref:type III secretion system co-regulatory protein PtrC n=1 Tax=Pseudomonas sp. 5P_3.1_Bac2 TaxID=2971617 RepID=UPI0021C7B201|nr:type III secretion system co-regulatory protein PtrC [Pseudomonas sp. 5P_3.1_Bac2]MCU1716233.1 hypothetical protein [Pseudomonas sp. 5P_3.1_Bac2]
MSLKQLLSQANVYGVTHATAAPAGLQFESEAAIHLNDGSVATVSIPTQAGERNAIEQFVKRCHLNH